MKKFALLLVITLASQVQAAESYTNALGMSFVKVPAGEFVMGSRDLDAVVLELPDGNEAAVRDETPAHRVVYPRGFYMGVTEVTREQWVEVMATRPGPESEWQRKDWRRLPVVSVSWFDVQAFIEALNKRDHEASYRLPTEAEWEYAARAGNQELRPVSVRQLGNYAWYIDSSGDELHPVATRAANPWGIHDLYGNVWEWLQDWYAPDQTRAGRKENQAWWFLPLPRAPGETGIPVSGRTWGRLFRGGVSSYCRTVALNVALVALRACTFRLLNYIFIEGKVSTLSKSQEAKYAYYLSSHR
jgi:formylglycine-generating enzyme required for sulfatase activity